ncbi:MAG: Na(+)/H(+) antiporter subunit B [Thermoplasmatota archaeon]
MIIELFLVLFLGSCFLVVFEKDLIRALVFLAMSSLFLVVLIYLYRAPDVALTMGVVSSAATTILFLAVIKKLEGIGYER